MPTAIYYPHTQIANPVVLKNALLLWDRVQTIVPFGWVAPTPDRRRPIHDAQELITEHRRPLELERHEAGRRLEALLNVGFLHKIVEAEQGRGRKALGPRDASYVAGAQRSSFPIYHDKFSEYTWRILQGEGLASIRGDSVDVPQSVGHMMMLLLADVCAGTQIAKVTDRRDFYSWLLKQREADLAGQVAAPDSVAREFEYDRLVTISIEAIDGRGISLELLLAMRRREMSSGSTDYARFRASYHKALQDHLKRLGTEAKSASDLGELQREFRRQIRDDVKDLKAELGLSAQKAMFSKEVVFSTLAVAGSFAAPSLALGALGASLGLAAIIPLLKTRAEFLSARRDALKRHQYSILYLASRPRFAAGLS